jgi:HlyD family secretion protein
MTSPSGRGTPRSAVHERALKRLRRSGYIAAGLFIGTVGVWTTTVSISGAVVAAAQFVVENSTKKVQHLTGGVVSDIKVREGALVHQGDVLIRLDETVTRTNLQIISHQLDEARVRSARLEAERDQAPRLEFPEALASRSTEPDFAVLLAAEKRLFDARAAARNGTRSQLTRRIDQLGSEITGLKGQMEAKVREAALTARELEGVRGLYKRNLVSLSRLSGLERDAVAIDGVHGQLAAQIAQADGKIAETELQILQINEDLRTEVLRDLRENEAKIAELVQRRAAAEDQFKRMEIRAPSSGYVHQLAVHNVGGVINPAEPVMLIVPSEEQLNLEAKVSPLDYDQLRLGQPVIVRIHAFNQRTTPELRGKIARMAPDVSKEQQSGASLYTIRIALLEGEIERLAPLEVKSGMQAEALVKTGDRTPLTFLLKPLSDQIARAFRER